MVATVPPTILDALGPATAALDAARTARVLLFAFMTVFIVQELYGSSKCDKYGARSANLR